MKKKLLKGVFVSTKNNNEIKADTMVDKLDEIYAKLDCDCIDIISTHIGNVACDIVYDDEGKLKADAMEHKPTIIFMHDNQIVDYITGNAFICKGDDSTGQLESLAPEEIARISKESVEVLFFGTPRKVLVARC